MMRGILAGAPAGPAAGCEHGSAQRLQWQIADVSAETTHEEPAFLGTRVRCKRDTLGCTNAASVFRGYPQSWITVNVIRHEWLPISNCVLHIYSRWPTSCPAYGSCSVNRAQEGFGSTVAGTNAHLCCRYAHTNTAAHSASGHRRASRCDTRFAPPDELLRTVRIARSRALTPLSG